MTCQQQAQQQAALLATIITTVMVAITIITVLSFYGWRRSRAPWRTISFTIFIICALLLVDSFTLALAESIAPSTLPAPAPRRVQRPTCPTPNPTPHPLQPSPSPRSGSGVAASS